MDPNPLVAELLPKTLGKLLAGMTPEEKQARIQAAIERLSARGPASTPLWVPMPTSEEMKKAEVLYAETIAFGWMLDEQAWWPTGESVRGADGTWAPEIATGTVLDDASELQSLRALLAEWMAGDRLQRIHQFFYDKMGWDPVDFLEMETNWAYSYGQLAPLNPSQAWEVAYVGGRDDAFGQGLKEMVFDVITPEEAKANPDPMKVWAGKTFLQRPAGLAPEQWPCAPLEWGCINSWVIRRKR